VRDPRRNARHAAIATFTFTFLIAAGAVAYPLSRGTLEHYSRAGTLVVGASAGAPLAFLAAASVYSPWRGSDTAKHRLQAVPIPQEREH